MMTLLKDHWLNNTGTWLLNNCVHIRKDDVSPFLLVMVHGMASCLMALTRYTRISYADG